MKRFERNGTLMLVAERGERLVDSLTRQLTAAGIAGGTLSGLGALTEVELGYYHLARKEYARREFNGIYELLSLNGNVALKDGAPFVHVHAVLGDADFATFGGHLFDATVAVTAELALVPFDFAPVRSFVPEIGLALCGNALYEGGGRLPQ